MKDKLLSFSDFETLYESYGFVNEDVEATVPQKITKPDLIMIDPETNEPKSSNPMEDLLAIFSEEPKGEDAKADKVEEDKETEAESTGEKKAVKKVKFIKPVSKPNSLTNAFSLRPIKLGENSERVKDVQKILKLTPDGNYGKESYNAVKAFQRENGLKIDGIVGVQTYGALLQAKKGITDPEELQKLIEELAKKIPTIVLDPKFYSLVNNITIVTINKVTYYIIIPTDDAKEKIQKLEEQKLTAGYEWITKIGEAIGKALIFTTVGLVLVPLEVAKSIISGAISMIKFVAKGAVSVCADVLAGLAGLGSLAKAGVSKLWATVKKGNDAVASYVKGFVQSAGSVLKTSAEGLIAFTAALGKFFIGSLAFLAIVSWDILKGLGSLLKGAWDGIKAGATALGNAAKKGFTWLGEKSKEVVNSISSGLTDFKNEAMRLGNKGKEVATQLVKGAGKGLAAVITFTGNMISGFGKSFGKLFDSLYLETGDQLYESLSLKLQRI
jgi:peptidoglycan hydrolase-like protein with peptidoglycan-binding domain